MAGDRQSTDRYEDGNDFWIAEILGTSVTIRFGKIGTTGHKASRDFSSFKDAKEFAEKRLQKKIEEGFKPV